MPAELNVGINGRESTRGAREVNSALDSIGNKSRSLISSAINPLTLAIGGIVSYQTVTGLTSVADKYTTMASQLEYVEGNAAAAEEAQEALYNMSQNTGTAVTNNADALVRLSQASEMMGTSTDENISIIGGLNALMLNTGTSTAGAAATMTQLTQALGSGVLQGDEFKSIMENSPALMRAFAGSMGVGIGELKKMASEGKITTEVMTSALRDIAEQGESSFDSLPKTASSGWQRVVNAFEKAWDTINDETGIMSFLFDALIDLSEWIEVNSPAFTLWIENLVNSIRQNWPEIKSSIDEVWQKIAGLWGQVSNSLPSMESFFSSLTTVVNGTATAIQGLITGFEWIFAQWDNILAIGQYSPLAAAARGAGTLAGGGSVGDAISNAFDADGSNLSPANLDNSSTNSNSVVNINVNNAVSRSDISNIAKNIQRDNSRL